ncbi:MAG: phosphate ABC transporter permease [Flavobacteriales bacterium]|nr:MAG: phosphate ABC transporter permease [Flavobacteriales bacterium]
MNEPQSNKIVVNATDSNIKLNLKELFRYKDLFLVLAYKDLRVRYAQTFLGLIWAIIQPLTTLAIMSVVFGRFVKVDTGGVPYPVFAVIGVSLWTYFSFVLSQSGNSIIGAQDMVKKIYFPRLIIPLSKAVVGLVDFLVAIILLIILFAYYGITPSSNIVFLPIFLILTIISSLAVGIWLSALTIRFRDFQYVVPFLVQFGLYITPIAYPTEIVVDNLPSWATVIFYLNPMTGIVEGYRWCLIGGPEPAGYFWLSISFVMLLFVSGIYYFKKIEKTMADII